ncbi:hypothetical protein ACVWXO_010902 [Bradyrhizobium sp. LM2.7]
MEQDLPKETARTQPPADAPGVWQRIQSWDSRLSVTKGLTAVTLLTGFLGGYFQYLNSYEQKIGEQAKADMEMATKTFLEISDAFADVQMQQETMLREQFGSLKAQASPAFIPVDSKTLEPLSDYWKARTSLRRNGANLRTQGGDLHRLAQRPWPRCSSRAQPRPGSPDGNAAHEVQFRLRLRSQSSAVQGGNL